MLKITTQTIAEKEVKMVDITPETKTIRADIYLGQLERQKTLLEAQIAKLQEKLDEVTAKITELEGQGIIKVELPSIGGIINK